MNELKCFLSILLSFGLLTACIEDKVSVYMKEISQVVKETEKLYVYSQSIYQMDEAEQMSYLEELRLQTESVSLQINQMDVPNVYQKAHEMLQSGINANLELLDLSKEILQMTVRFKVENQQRYMYVKEIERLNERYRNVQSTARDFKKGLIQIQEIYEKSLTE